MCAVWCVKLTSVYKDQANITSQTSMPGLRGLRKPRNAAQRDRSLDGRSTFCDAITLGPFLVWLAVSVAAIVSYGQIGWYAPIACATYSTIMSAVATVNLWGRSHVRMIYLQIDDGPMQMEKEGSRLRWDLCVGCFFAMLALAWAIVDVVAISQISAASQTLPQPCDGRCGACTSDPHCKVWAANMALTTPIVAVCPTARRHTSTEGNATFSCTADAAWMFLTFSATVIWICSLLTRKPHGARPVVSGIETVSPPPNAPRPSCQINALVARSVVEAGRPVVV